MEVILVPAAVAAFVTLVIEYFAKPSLEVRKERILDKHRVARAINTAFQRCAFDVGRVLAHVDRDDSFAVLKADAYRQLLVDAEDLRSRLMDPSSLYTLQLDSLLGFSSYTQLLRVTMENGGDESMADKILKDRIDPYCDLAAEALRMTWWNVPQRLRVKNQLDALKIRDDQRPDTEA